MRNMVKITAAVLALTMLTSCGQLDDTSKAETKTTSAMVTTTNVEMWKPSFENATTFTTTTTSVTTTTTPQNTTTKTTTTKKTITTVQDNSGNGGVVYYPSQDNNDYYYENNQPSYSEDNSDDYYYEQPQQTEQPRQTTTTKKETQPSKPSCNKITQADIDAMKKELQEYSNSKAEYVNAHYTEFWKYGIDFNTIEEYYELCISEDNPDNSGYDKVNAIELDETQDMLQEFIGLYKEYIDYEYEKRSDAYYVVYAEYCPNGHNVNSNPCWAVYLLY